MTIRKVHGVTVDADTVDGNDSAAMLGVGAFVKDETRASDAESGDVAYTGYGFQPVSLIIIGNTGTSISLGRSNASLAEICVTINADGSSIVSSAYVTRSDPGATNHQDAVLKTYDADGFTLTWTKNGVAHGTFAFTVFAFKG